MRTAIAVILVVNLAAPVHAAEVLLKNSWIEKHKNRVTADIKFTLDVPHKNPNTQVKDGDMHLAGRSKEVGLPMVAEIVNARLPVFKGIVAFIKANADSKPVITMSGAWRLWFEHPSADPQQQGAPVDEPENSNPDHVFEIHPVTKWNGTSLSRSFVDIDGYEAYDAETAFALYEKMRVTATKGPTFTSLVSTKKVYNYANFRLVLTSAPEKVSDGFMVLAHVTKTKGKVLVTIPHRMVIAGDTAAAGLIAKAKKGDRFDALGIPRLNLERIMHLADEADGEPVVVTVPYEMIIVALSKP